MNSIVITLPKIATKIVIKYRCNLSCSRQQFLDKLIYRIFIISVTTNLATPSSIISERSNYLIKESERQRNSPAILLI